MNSRIARLKSFQYEDRELPNELSERLANIAYEMFTTPPKYVDLSTDSGICMSIRKGDKYADIECFNDGQILTATCSDGKLPEILSWSESTISDAIKMIEGFCYE
jgi:hypothetical protein